MKQIENCKQPSAPPPLFSRRIYILCIDHILNAYDMPIPRYIATLALKPKSALNKCWLYIEGALYFLNFFEDSEDEIDLDGSDI